MVKKAIFFLFALVFVSAVFVACQEDDTSIRSTKTHRYNSSIAGNLRNPYDSVGIHHNLYLSDVFTQMYNSGLRPNDLAFDESFSYINNYIVQRRILYPQYVDRILTRQDCRAILDNQNEFYLGIIRNTNISTHAKDYLVRLFNDVRNTSDTNYYTYKDVVCRAESRIIADTTLNEVEKSILLSSTSVFRHSLYYWFDNTEVAALPDWLVIAGADAAAALAGAAEGATTGAGIGAVVGNAGTGAAVGAIIGGIAGAIQGSANKAIELDSARTLEDEENPQENIDEDQGTDEPNLPSQP